MTPRKAIRDIDFLARGARDEGAIRTALRHVCGIPCREDGVVFDPATISITSIRIEQPDYGRQACRPRPAQVDEHYSASAPAACPDCGGTVEVTRVATQYPEDLPVVRPLVRRFDIDVGHCSQCRRRVQGRHPLQTSDALGAASVQLGPEVVALVVELHTHLANGERDRGDTAGDVGLTARRSRTGD